MRIIKQHGKLLACLVLVTSVIAVYWQTLHHDFVNFDDPSYVYDNEFVKSGLNARSIRWAFSYTENIDLVGLWLPLAFLSHMLDCQIYGLNPAGHHLTNVILHIVNSLLILLAFTYMTRRFWLSFALACLFALHPLRVESVAWITERKDVLSMMFALIAIIAYVGFVRSRRPSRYIIALVSFALGLLTKPTLVTLPFVLLLLDYWPLKRFQIPESVHSNSNSQESLVIRSRIWLYFRALTEKLPFFILSGLDSVMIYSIQKAVGSVAQEAGLSLISRISNALISYAEYVEKFFLPIRLQFFYPHPGKNVSVSYVAVSVVTLCAISAVLIYFYRRQYTLVGWLWYLGTLVPVIGLVQSGSAAMADRYTYIPGIGLAIIVVWGLADLTKNIKAKPLKILLILLFTLAYCSLGFLSWRQVKTWKNDMALFSHAVKVNPKNWYAHEMLANTLYYQGQYDKAIEHYKQAVKIRPSPRIQNYIGEVLITQKKYHEAVLLYDQLLPPLPDTNQTAEIDPVKYGKLYNLTIIYADSHVNCGFALWQTGRVDEALAHFYEALRVRPDYVPAHTNLVNLFLGRGDYGQAIRQSRELLKLTPQSSQAYANLGLALFNSGRYDQAIANFERAIVLDPYETILRYHLAEALEITDQIDRAIEEYRKVLPAYPDWLALKNKLAFLLAAYKETKYHDPKKAIDIAEQICEQLEYTQPEPMDTLAIAYAADGNFTSAIKIAQRALKLAQDADNGKLARDIRGRLHLYKSGQAYYRPSSGSKN